MVNSNNIKFFMLCAIFMRTDISYIIIQSYISLHDKTGHFCKILTPPKLKVAFNLCLKSFVLTMVRYLLTKKLNFHFLAIFLKYRPYKTLTQVNISSIYQMFFVPINATATLDCTTFFIDVSWRVFKTSIPFHVKQTRFGFNAFAFLPQQNYEN